MNNIELLKDRLAGAEEINEYRSWPNEDGIVFSTREAKAILDELIKLRDKNDKLITERNENIKTLKDIAKRLYAINRYSESRFIDIEFIREEIITLTK